MKSAKIPLLEIGKWLLVVLLVVYIVFQLSSGKVSDAPFQDVSDAVASAADTSIMSTGNNQMLKRLYGLDPSEYEGILLYCPTTNMGAEEILLVKLTDVSQQDTVRAAIEARLATQLSNFDGYGVSQTEMLNNAVLEVQGNYILFAVAADPAPIRQAFLDAL